MHNKSGLVRSLEERALPKIHLPEVTERVKRLQMHGKDSVLHTTAHTNSPKTPSEQCPKLRSPHRMIPPRSRAPVQQLGRAGLAMRQNPGGRPTFTHVQSRSIKTRRANAALPLQQAASGRRCAVAACDDTSFCFGRGLNGTDLRVPIFLPSRGCRR